ncbi:MAG: cysteine desulfurase family protein [Chlamydiota bacterium]
MKRIYLDNNATTCVDPRVVEAIHKELLRVPSNPSSMHYFGQEARKRLLHAREIIASFLICKPQEIIFTSGATESLNTLLNGIKASHIISSNIEHASVYNTLKNIEKKGTRITFLSPDATGSIDPQAVRESIKTDTGLLVFAAANSETGVKNDIEALAHLATSSNIPLIVDGVALLGKEPFQIPLGVSAMAFSGHKLHAPQGIGFTFIRSSFKITPLFTGGDQEYSKRAGTENLPGIVALARAIEILKEIQPEATEHMRRLRDHFENTLKTRFNDIVINGNAPRIPNTSNLSFLGIDGETLLIQLDRAGIAASHGSACASGALEPSRILTHMQLSKERIRSAIRFSLSRFTTQDEIDHTINIITNILKK